MLNSELCPCNKYIHLLFLVKWGSGRIRRCHNVDSSLNRLNLMRNLLLGDDGKYIHVFLYHYKILYLKLVSVIIHLKTKYSK